MAFLKSTAACSVLGVVQDVETRANDCWKPLRLLAMPSDIATWEVADKGFARVERSQAVRGQRRAGASH
jgi:hypothetical protein